MKLYQISVGLFHEFCRMNILLIGSGGREHALAWKMAQSPLTSRLYIVPGNAGTAQIGENVALDPLDFVALAEFVIDHKVEMVVVGPEVPLVHGIADFFARHASLKNVAVVGPGASGARLEGSKDFSKGFMLRNGIPTARYESFTRSSIADGKTFLRSLKPPYVIKASGPAAGKGVVICPTLEEAESELEEMLSGKFGASGETVVIEEYLDGIECSVFVLTDGNTALILPEAKDYKRIGEMDTGPNTGGMGAVSPVPFCTPEFMARVQSRIIQPTLDGLKQEDISYKGFIFFGLMNVEGDPYVIEYNCRMGDPETEVVLPRLKNDLVELFVAMDKGTLDRHIIQTDPRIAVTVMTVAGGYPGDYRKGDVITGVNSQGDVIPFHAGTIAKDGAVVTNGGRIISFTGMGDSLESVLTAVYNTISEVNFEGMYYRSDIGQDLLKRSFE